MDKFANFHPNPKDSNEKYMGQTKRFVSPRFKEHWANLKHNRIEKTGLAIFEKDHIYLSNVKLICAISNYCKYLNFFESVENCDKGPILRHHSSLLSLMPS